MICTSVKKPTIKMPYLKCYTPALMTKTRKPICHSFQNETSGIRVLLATIAFGMGVDYKYGG